jgi:diguanylate cyclase (GGDEF)-like protein
MTRALDSARLLAVIETQNEIAATALDLDALMAFVAERARELTRAGASVIELPEDDELVYRVATGSATEFVGLRLPMDASLSGLCARQGRVLRCNDARTDPRANAEATSKVGAVSMICVPLRHGGQVAGVLEVTAPVPDHFTDDDVTVLGLLSGVIGAHMGHASHFEVIRRQSRQDPLTGLGNRRAFQEELATAVRVAVRQERPLALSLLDVDGFKRVNDTHGHPAGDAVLAGIGEVLRAGRAGDKAYRLGGDEFALLMPDTTLAGAKIATARVTATIASEPISGFDVAMSAGAAERGAGDADDLYAAADAALYDAKARGTRA